MTTSPDPSAADVGGLVADSDRSGADAYYVPLGDNRYQPTRLTESPWDRAAQHGGPPAALLGTAIADSAPPGLRLARISLDFLGPIPRDEVVVEVTPVRPGRRVHLTDATMSAGGRPVVLARAWHIAVGARPPIADLPEIPDHTDDSIATVEPAELPSSSTPNYFAGLERWGYGESIEWRFALGGFDVLGDADVWTKVQFPLIAGRPLTGLQRALIVADSANGLSARLPMAQWFSIPPTMSTTLLRYPVGAWVRMNVATTLTADGLGIARGEIGDAFGPVGEVSQPLLVAAR